MARKQTQHNHYLRSGLILHPDQQQAIDKVMINLAQQIATHFLLLVDVSGQVVTSYGEQSQIDLTALGSLVAGDLAASHEIARLTSQYQPDQLILREGQTTHTFTCEAGYHLALLVQVSRETPLGWARIVIRKAAHELANIAENPPKPNKEQDSATELPALEEELSDLFDDALDDLWVE